jgi:NADPH:quinone reductase
VGRLVFPTLLYLTVSAPLGSTSVNNYLVTLEERNRYSSELWASVSSGILKINIGKEYPFTAEGVRRAHTDLTTGATAGKLLIKVA